MATIEKKKCGDRFNYRISIRKKGIEIYKTFLSEEDAKLFIFYKERLIDNMANFDIPIKDRITLEQLFEIKREDSKFLSKRSINELDMVLSKVINFLPKKRFYHQFSYDDWIECAKSLLKMDSFRGSKNNIIKISYHTLRRYFATLASVISYAISQGLALENHPQKVINTFILPLIDSEEDTKKIIPE